MKKELKTSQIFETATDVYSPSEQLGEGGSGKVLKVQNEGGESFALKLLNSQYATRDKRKRFKNELEFGKKNFHKNIVPVLDSGFVGSGDKKQMFFIMPFFPLSFRAYLDGGYPTDKKFEYFSKILDGVEAAHLLGIVHRDIKPENIFVDPKASNLVVGDWGIARFTEDLLHTLVETSPQSRLANFLYSAPEQRQKGGIVDSRSDIYALGLLLNEIFTGKVIAGSGYEKIGNRIKEYGYLDPIVDKMVAQNPADRFSTISEIKIQINAKKTEFASYQTLNALKTAVVPESQVQDPLVLNPPKLVSIDYKNHTLFLTLNFSVNRDWQAIFANPSDGYSSIMGYGPSAFEWRGATAQVQTDERTVQELVNYFKGYVEMANRGYARHRKAEIENDRRKRDKEAKERIEAEERRLKLLSSVVI